MTPKTILVVDDTAEVRCVFSTILQHAGYGVIEAVNGAEGVERAREHRPALILMDLAMPVMSGREATQQIKADPATAEIPVIAATAHVLFREDHENLRTNGFAGCLHKPLTPSRLLTEVHDRIGPAAVS